MSEIVPAYLIEEIVGVARHRTRHYARAVSGEQTVYVLHSQDCLDSGRDLRLCMFSVALDKGIDLAVWGEHQDQPHRVTIGRSGRLIPNVPGMRVSES